MATCRELIKRAVQSFGAGFGDDLILREVQIGLEAVQDEMRALHEARGPLYTVDVTDDYTAGENERVRVQNGYTVDVSLPNSIRALRRSDYGEISQSDQPTGSSAVADGVIYRAPRDGSRVEIVGTTQGLYFYRSDTNEWVNCNALTIDGSMPLNAAYLADFAAILAHRLCPIWPSTDGKGAMVLREPTPSLMRAFHRAKHRLYGRPGVERDAVAGSYF